MSQCDKILNHLKQGNSITSKGAMDDFGIGRLASRINDIKKLGYDIRDEFITVQNRHDSDCHVKKYWLHLPEVGTFQQRELI